MSEKQRQYTIPAKPGYIHLEIIGEDREVHGSTILAWHFVVDPSNRHNSRYITTIPIGFEVPVYDDEEAIITPSGSVIWRGMGRWETLDEFLTDMGERHEGAPFTYKDYT